MKIYHWSLKDRFEIYAAGGTLNSAIKKAINDDSSGYLFTEKDLRDNTPEIIQLKDFALSYDRWDA